MKYAVVMTSDHTAKLFAGRMGTRIGMISKADLNSALPVAHPAQRVIIDKLLSDNNITVLSFDVQNVDKDTTILHGEFINYKSPEQKLISKIQRKERKQSMAKMHAEAGFNLIELAAACAIMAVLYAVSIPHYNGFIEGMNEKVAQIELHNQNNQADLDALLNAVN